MLPPAFQAPAFDRLKQSEKAWAKEADEKWHEHREGFLKRTRMWVHAGIDDEVAPLKVTRGTGKQVTIRADPRARGRNIPLERRDEWAAKYLLGVPIKEIAAQSGANPSTVGRVARTSSYWPVGTGKEKNGGGACRD